MARFKDLTKMHFDRLTVICRSEDTGNGKKPVTKWVCECKCGEIITVKSDALLSGHTTSCGCKTLKHGHANKERLYQTWKNMRRRCCDPKNSRYEQYGGRGITICPEWEDYGVFREWAISNGYADDLTIDRINVNGNYEPSNCRWADAKTQANNVSRNRILIFAGLSLTMSEWADLIGISYGTINHRVQNHWPMVRIITTPERGREHEFKGLPARVS